TSDAAAARRLRRKKKSPPILIGWREWAAFPELGVPRIKAKVDTGAKTAALHAYRVETRFRGGVEYAEFYVCPQQKRRRPEIFCTSPVVDRRGIRSSNGVVEQRLIIRTSLSLGEREWPIDVSLADRDAMGFRLLLGRDSFRMKFLIDPKASFLLGK
ncbi:MAG: RimK/LysX family protein, partial [Parvularculaceae bacterium]